MVYCARRAPPRLIPSMTTLYHPRPERWPQVSLRTLFALVFLLAIPLGWLGVQLKWIRDRHAASEWIDGGTAAMQSFAMALETMITQGPSWRPGASACLVSRARECCWSWEQTT